MKNLSLKKKFSEEFENEIALSEECASRCAEEGAMYHRYLVELSLPIFF
jgi:hypothetical protein